MKNKLPTMVINKMKPVILPDIIHDNQTTCTEISILVFFGEVFQGFIARSAGNFTNFILLIGKKVAQAIDIVTPLKGNNRLYALHFKQTIHHRNGSGTDKHDEDAGENEQDKWKNHLDGCFLCLFFCDLHSFDTHPI